MRVVLLLWVVTGMVAATPAAGQVPAGALAIDERQGDQWGWAVDYETAEAARARALRECGGGCSVVLTFGRCGAYAADQDADSTAVGWAESYDSAAGARQAALSECRARGGGSACVVRAWGCNGPVVEEGLGLDRAARRQIQLGLRAGGFDPGERTGCSARGRGRRSEAGSRRGVHAPPGIWTDPRRRGCGRPVRRIRRLWPARPPRRHPCSRPPRRPWPLQSRRICSGSRS